MNYPFATPSWTDALHSVINSSRSYREAARNWEGDFWFIVEPDAGVSVAAQPVRIYVDLWHGECRAARILQLDEDGPQPEFRIWGTRPRLARVIRREVDPIKALLTSTLKLNGNLAKVMRNVKAAQELVLCAAAVPTEF